MNHQKLKCYCELIDVAKKVPSLINTLPRGESYIIDQLKRALSSAILNLAEGNGVERFVKGIDFLTYHLLQLLRSLHQWILFRPMDISLQNLM